MAEISKQIENAIIELKQQRKILEDKINADELEKSELETNMNDIQTKVQMLKSSIISSNKTLEELINTITETENGYEKLLAAGQTLMEIVSKNMERNDFCSKIDSS